MFVSKTVESEILVTAEAFSGHVGSNSEDYEDQHGGYDYGVTNKEGESILDFCAAMSMNVGNKLFQKRTSHQVTFEPGPSKHS